MSAPIGTRIASSADGVVFTKTGEGAWQHSEEDAPRTAQDGLMFALAIRGFEDAATNLDAREFYASQGYTVLEPAQS